MEVIIINVDPFNVSLAKLHVFFHGNNGYRNKEAGEAAIGRVQVGGSVFIRKTIKTPDIRAIADMQLSWQSPMFPLSTDT